MIKKIAVLLLIFVLLTAAIATTEATGLSEQIRQSTIGFFESAIYQVSELAGKLTAAIGQTTAAFNQASSVPSTAAPSPSSLATPAPSPSASPTPTPAPSPSAAPNLFGAIVGQAYTNDAAGFCFDYPGGYQALDEQAINENIINKTDALKDAYSDADKMNELLRSGTIPVFVASKHPFDYAKGYNATISVNIIESKNQDASAIWAMADYMQFTFSKTQGYSKIQEPKSTEINGSDSVVLNATVTRNKVSVSQRIYLLKSNNWILMITLAAANKSEMNEMDKAVRTLQITADVSGSGVAPVAQDFGFIAGQTYTNEAGGFLIDFPAGFTAINKQDAMKTYMLQSFAAYKSIYKDPDAIRQSIEEGSSNVFIAYRHRDGFKAGFFDEISISLTKMDIPVDILAYADALKQYIPFLTDAILMNDPVAVEISGTDGALLEDTCKIGSYTILNKILLFEKNGYIVSVDISALDETGMNEMEQILDTIKILSGV